MRRCCLTCNELNCAEIINIIFVTCRDRVGLTIARTNMFSVALLVERSLPIPEVRSSNPVIGKKLFTLNICLVSTVYRKDENKEKEAWPVYKKRAGLILSKTLAKTSIFVWLPLTNRFRHLWVWVGIIKNRFHHRSSKWSLQICLDQLHEVTQILLQSLGVFVDLVPNKFYHMLAMICKILQPDWLKIVIIQNLLFF